MAKTGWLLLIIFLVSVLVVQGADIEQKVIQEIKKEAEVSVIVVLKDESPFIKDSEIKKEAIKENQKEVLNDLVVKEKNQTPSTFNNESYDLEIKHQYTTINAFSGNVTKEGLEKLKDNPQVEKILINEVQHLFLDESVPLISSNSVWNITVNNQSINGSGETVCVIDTGIDYNHSFLGSGWGNKVLDGYDYYNGDSDPMDDHGHGTHVAGIVASRNETYRGVAPEAKLIAMKVCSSSGLCPNADILAGIDWCINNATRYNISVISISLGGDQFKSYCDNNETINTQFTSGINNAVSKNISVVIATGNTNAQYTNATAGVAFPSCIQNATRVTATSKADTMASYAFRYNFFTDIVAAPGGTTNSGDCSNNDALCSAKLNGGIVGYMGTSMATPHVSGAVALTRQYWRLAYNQTPTPEQIKNKILWTGININDQASSNANYTRINNLKLIQPYLNFTATSTPNNTNLFRTSTLVNITSDVSLLTAWLEWTYPNGTVRNYTLNQSTATNWHYNITGLTSGNHNYVVYGNDTANTTGSSSGWKLQVNIFNISLTSPRNNSYYPGFFYLNFTIANIELTSVSYNITNITNLVLSWTNTTINPANFSWTELTNLSNSSFNDGNYTLTVDAKNSVGDSDIKQINFQLDKILPRLSDFNRSPELIYHTTTVYFSVNVTDSNINNSAVLIEGNWSGALINYTLDLETSNKFNYTLNFSNLSSHHSLAYRFYATDLAGNTNYSQQFNFSVQNRNIYFINITSLANGTILELGNITPFNASALDHDNDTLAYSWSFGDANYSTQQNPLKQFNSTGTYTIILNVSDNYGSVNYTNITVIVNDTQAPENLSLSHDSSVHIQSELNQTVNFTVFDHSGISALNLYYLNHTKNKTCTNNNLSWTCRWSWNNLSSAGTYNFTIEAIDNFSTTHAKNYSYSFALTSCSDSAQNGNENGVDCGGSCPTSCPTGNNQGGGGGGGGGGSSSSISTAVATAITPTPKPAVVQETPTAEKKTTAISTSSSLPPAPVPPPPAPQKPDNSFSTKLNLMEGTNKIQINKEKISLAEITLKTKEEAKDIQLEIKNLGSKPAEVPELNNVYQYLELKTNLKEENIKEVLMLFKVPSSWILNNNYTEVSLNLYSNGQWSKQKTSLVSSQGETWTYQAKAKQLNYLAISGETAKPNVVGRAFGYLINITKTNAKQKVLIGLFFIILILLVTYVIIRKRNE